MAFDIDKFLPVSWDDYFKSANKLADDILASGQQFDRVVGITRCGLTLGHFLSDALSLPVSVFTIKSYTDINKQGDVEITDGLSAEIKGHKILLVDGLADTGKTFIKGVFYLQTKNPESIKTAALFYKPHSLFKPDYFSETTEKWVLLPYEFTENATLLKNMLDRGNEPVKPNLLKLGYKEEDLKILKKRGVL